MRGKVEKVMIITTGAPEPAGVEMARSVDTLFRRLPGMSSGFQE